MNETNECPWPHVVSSPVCVYDRESYDKYQSGEYTLPERCICGAPLVYDEPITIVLVEYGDMTGEVQLETVYSFIERDLRDEAKKPLFRAARDYESFAARATEDLKAKTGVAGEIEAQKWSEGMAQTMGYSFPKVECPPAVAYTEVGEEDVTVEEDDRK